MKQRIPIGISDFKKLREENCYFIDKSLIIKEFMDINAEVVLIPRPRRFGKTLNMSMIRYFFQKNVENSRSLFNGLAIENEKDLMEMQGEYPVIFITFKDEKQDNFENFKASIRNLMSDLYVEHYYCMENSNLLPIEKDFYNKILNKQGDIVDLSTALGKLSKYLCQYYNKKVILLIDEYDVPIQAAYVKEYYEDTISFMRNLLSAALKDNIYIEKAMVTGILRVAKESIFSGLNNLKVSSLIRADFSDKFGFNQSEVEELLRYYTADADLEKVRKWYNGYIFGNEVIYNPWSILNYLDNQEEGLKAHWVNTSSNDLVNILLAKGSEDIKKDLEVLIQDGEIIKNINDTIIMSDIDKSSENLWSFLLFTGYLKAYGKEVRGLKEYYKLKIPNLEIKSLYYSIIENWFEQSISTHKYELLLKSLVTGDIKVFGKLLKQFVINSISYFDVGGYEGEKVYHAFVLGLLVSLNETHEVLSNRESGYGRYDIMIIPRNLEKLGLVIEFKKLDIDDNETMEESAEDAMKQIQSKEYSTTLLNRGVKNRKELAIVFKGKEIFIKEKK